MCCKVEAPKWFKKIACCNIFRDEKSFSSKRLLDSYFSPKRRLNAFTLVEVLVVVGILTVVIVGMLNLFVYTSATASLAGNKTTAVAAAQSKMEEIRSHDYDLILTDYVSGGTLGDTFLLNSPNGIGTIYIDSTDPDLLEIRIVVCWEDKHDRIIGEDINLNGILDIGEDLDLSGEIDSIVNLVMLNARK